jgi:hypothetical protein
MKVGWNRILRVGLVSALPAAWLVWKWLPRPVPGSE